MPPPPEGSTTTSSRRRFPALNVGASLELSLRRRVEGLVKETLKRYDAHHEGINLGRWRHIRSRGGLDAFLDRQGWAAGAPPSLLATGTIPGRLEDLLLGLYADESEDTRVLQHLLNRRSIDAEVLHTFERQPPGDATQTPPRYLGIKWSLMHPPGGGTLTANRDVCYVEKLGTLLLPASSSANAPEGSDVGKPSSTRTIGYYAVQSVDLPECQPRANSSVQRAKIAMCVLLEQVTADRVRVYTRVKLESQLSPLLTKIAIRSTADVALSTAKVLDVVAAKRCTALLTVARYQAKSPLSSRCQICEHAPKLLGRLKSCAVCARSSICRSCRVKCPSFRRDLASKATRVLSVELCHVCADSITIAPLESLSQHKTPRTNPRSDRGNHVATAIDDDDDPEEDEDRDDFTASSSSSSFLSDLDEPLVSTRRFAGATSPFGTSRPSRSRPLPSPSAVVESPLPSPSPSSSPSPSEARATLLNRLAAVSATAEATFLLAKEQSEVARVLWERNNQRHDGGGSFAGPTAYHVH